MATKVTLTSAGTIGDLQPGWSVSEEATPVAIGDSSGALDSASLSTLHGEDSEFAIADPIKIEHDELGSFSGFSASITSNGATEETDTTVSISAMSDATTLTTQKTAVVIAGLNNMVRAGSVLNASDSIAGPVSSAIATGPAGDGNIYRAEQNGAFVGIASWSYSGQKSFINLTGTNSPTNVGFVESLAVTPTLFIVFYRLAGVRKLGFFNKTTGVITTSIGAVNQFSTGDIYWDPTNNLVYVANSINNVVQVFYTNGTSFFQFSSQGARMVTGTSNAIYVSTGVRVYEYTLNGSFTGKSFPTGGIQGLAISPDGAGLVTIFNSRLSLWNLDTTEFISDKLLDGVVSIFNITSNSNFVYVAARYVSGAVLPASIEMVAVGQTSLYTTFAYYAALGQINSISYQVDFNMLIPSPGWTDTPWNKMKELASAYGVEIAVVSGVLTIRNIAKKTLSLDNVVGKSVSLSASILQSAKSVDIEYRNTSPATYGYFYSADPGAIISVQRGEVYYATFTTDHQISRVDQPIFDITYAVTDTAGVRVTARQWAESGGSMTYTLDPAIPNSVQVFVVAPKELIPGTNGSFQIGVADLFPKTTVVATNLATNPVGVAGTGWGRGPNLTVVYSAGAPVWTHTAGTSGNAYFAIPIAPMDGNRTYKVSISIVITSGSATGFNIIQTGSLPFGAIGSMTQAGNVWSWEGQVYSASNNATPAIWVDVQGTGTGEKFTLANSVMVEQLSLTSPSQAAPFFDGAAPAGTGGPYTYAWKGTPYASASTKTLVEQPISRFFIKGNGLFTAPATINLLTGADPEKTSNERASDISNPFVQTATQAYSRGVWRSEQLSGPQVQLSATVPTSELEGFGLTAGSRVSFKDSKYRITSVNIGAAVSSITAVRHVTQADVQDVNGGRTAGQLATFWRATKQKDQIMKPLKDATDLFPYGAVGQSYYATADSFGTTLGSVSSYIHLLAADLSSSPYYNVSVGGRSALDGANAGWGTTVTIPYNMGPNAFGHIAYGINPAAQHGTNQLARDAEKQAMELLIWAMCAESTVSNDAWTKVGALWSAYANVDLKDGGAYLANNVTGHYATITPAAGSYVGVGYTYTTSGGAAVAGTGQWTRGGGIIQYNETAKSPTTAFGAILVPHPVRLMNLNGSTQIRMDATTNQYTFLDSLVKLSATPPWIVIVKPTYVSSTSLYNIPRATIDAYRADIDSVVESVANAYTPVGKKLIVVDPVAVGWNAEIHTSADGLHPNDLGTAFLKEAVKKAIAFAMSYPPAV